MASSTTRTSRSASRRCRGGTQTSVPLPTISVSINTANATNWAAFRRDYLESIERHQPKWRTTAVAGYMTLFAMVEQTFSRA